VRKESGALTDRSAEISRLYQDEYAGLLRLGILLVGDRGVAEDVVQDAFVALQRRWEVLSDRASAAGYVRVSVINGARSVRRRWSVARRYLHLAEPMTVPAADATALLAAEHHAVVAAVRRLPRRQQQVIVLRYWSEMSEAQIAGTLQVSAGTVKSSASRALASLARQLGVDHDQ
jgi:RNA polymerase sigma-70 factor (sigma-E family)